MSIVKTLISSMFKKSATVSYPIKPKLNDPLVRGHIEVDIDTCIFCGMCQRKCPTGAIEVSKQDETWAITRLNCICCNNCVEVCPKKCLSMDSELMKASFEKTKDVVKRARISAEPSDNTEGRGEGQRVGHEQSYKD